MLEEKNVKFLKKRNSKMVNLQREQKEAFGNKCGASLFFKVIGGKVIHKLECLKTKLKTSSNIFVK